MEFLLYFLVWFGTSFAVGKVGQGRSVGFATGFLLSLIFSPVVGIIVVLLMKPNPKLAQEQALASGSERKCPFCAELIKVEAKVCRYCGRDQPSPTLEASSH